MTHPLAARAGTPAHASAPRRSHTATAAAPLVLTARPLLRARPDLAPALAAAQLDLRIVASWERLLEAAERAPAAILLLDMDAADASGKRRHALSGHRIASLLARGRGPYSALVVLTSMDFVEIEDLVRAGISQLLSPQIPTKALALCLRAAALRAQSHRSAPAPRPTPTPIPIPAPASASAAPPIARVEEALWRSACAVFAGQPAIRSRIPNARILAAVLYLLRTGSPWSALPPEFGSVRTVRRRLLQWRDTGTLDGLRTVLTANGIAFPASDWERLTSSPRARQPLAVVC